MPWYPDLSEYEHNRSILPLRNVGWLDGQHEFTTGMTAAHAVAAMARLARTPDARMRGSLRCPVCGDEQSQHVDAHGEKILLTHAEIRVCGADGTWFSAPTLVLHHIDAHGYLPPAAFLAALQHPQSPEVLTLRRLDNLVRTWIDDEQLADLLRWLRSDDAPETWVPLTGHEPRAWRRGGDVVLTVAEADDDEPDPDETVTCAEAVLVEALAVYLARKA